jgi:hypothetical protein
LPYYVIHDIICRYLIIYFIFKHLSGTENLLFASPTKNYNKRRLFISMSEFQPEVIDIGTEEGKAKVMGYRLTTLGEILRENNIKAPECLKYLFIMDIKLSVYPSELTKCIKIIRKDAANFHTCRESKRATNFFSLLFDKEGSILWVMVREFGTADIPTVKEHCRLNMNCDNSIPLLGGYCRFNMSGKNIILCANIINGGNITGA